MELSKQEVKVFEAVDKLLQCERTKCRKEAKAWSEQNSKLFKKCYGMIDAEKASPTMLKEAAIKVKEGLAKQNDDKMKCAIKKCETQMWKCLDEHKKLFVATCKYKSNKYACDLVIEATNIQKSKNASECHRFITKTFSSELFR